MQTSKRFTILIAVMMLFAATLALTGTATATNGTGPYTLYAGQDMPVGEVTVTNDADYLYVTYVIDEPGWCMTESHLAVATSLEGIPQRRGNPVPGLFSYQTDHDPCVASYTYEVEITWPAGTELFLAAHAVVKYVETTTATPVLDWQRGMEDTSVPAFAGYGGGWTPAQGFLIALNPLQEVWDGGLYWPAGDTSVPTGPFDDITFASWSYAYTNPDGGAYAGYSDLRRFQASFTVPEGCAVTGGMLRTPDFADGIPINDNLYIFINGQDNLLFWGGTRANVLPAFEGMAGVQALRGGVVGARVPAVSDGWYIPGELPEVTSFVDGINTIDIFTEENERWGSMGEPVLDLDCQYTTYETAWGYGEDFPGANWATYFRYEIEPVLVDTVEVPGTGGTVESIVLADGVDFEFRASGTYRFANWGAAGIADAQCSYRVVGEPWVNGDDLSSANYLEVWVDEAAFGWQPGDCQADHLYTGGYTGDGSTAEFFIPDSCGGGTLGCYSDNSGFITVDIYWLG
jgi:hypothetical protein